MGCCGSGEPQQALVPEFIDIPLLQKPPPTRSEDGTCQFFSVDSYVEPTRGRLPSYDGYFVEHVPKTAAPVNEGARRQRFTEKFSRSDGRVFENIPIVAVTGKCVSAETVAEYEQFMDRVVDAVVGPLVLMTVSAGEPLAVRIQ